MRSSAWTLIRLRANCSALAQTDWVVEDADFSLSISHNTDNRKVTHHTSNLISTLFSDIVFLRHCILRNHICLSSPLWMILWITTQVKFIPGGLTERRGLIFFKTCSYVLLDQGAPSHGSFHVANKQTDTAWLCLLSGRWLKWKSTLGQVKSGRLWHKLKPARCVDINALRTPRPVQSRLK